MLATELLPKKVANVGICKEIHASTAHEQTSAAPGAPAHLEPLMSAQPEASMEAAARPPLPALFQPDRYKGKLKVFPPPERMGKRKEPQTLTNDRFKAFFHVDRARGSMDTTSGSQVTVSDDEQTDQARTDPNTAEPADAMATSAQAAALSTQVSQEHVDSIPTAPAALSVIAQPEGSVHQRDSAEPAAKPSDAMSTSAQAAALSAEESAVAVEEDWISSIYCMYIYTVFCWLGLYIQAKKLPRTVQWPLLRR